MARQSRPTFQKRLKEKARMEKQREKTARKFEAKDRKSAAADERSTLGVNDPDLDGITLGPQAPPDEWAAFMPTEEEKEEEEEGTEETESV
jgi:hypothetical protein